MFELVAWAAGRLLTRARSAGGGPGRTGNASTALAGLRVRIRSPVCPRRRFALTLVCVHYSGFNSGSSTAVSRIFKRTGIWDLLLKPEVTRAWFCRDFLMSGAVWFTVRCACL